MKPQNILSIESAVAEGSVALIENGNASVVRREGTGCSRAEKLLFVIDGVLDEAGLALRDLDLIAVSTGPGSYSGIRIGLSTARGLASALRIPCVGASVLESMAFADRCSRPIITAVPVGKNDVAWQVFEHADFTVPQSFSAPQLTSFESFYKGLGNLQRFSLFAHGELYGRVLVNAPEIRDLVDAGTGLAEFIGLFALTHYDHPSSLQPIYLRNMATNDRARVF